MNKHIEALEAQHKGIVAEIDELMVRANGALSAEDEAESDAMYVRAAEVKAKIEKAVENAKAVTPVTIPAVANRAMVEDATDDIAELPTKVVDKILGRALATTANAGAGSKPYIVTSDLFRFVDAERRVINSFGHKQTMPNAISWNVLVETGIASVGVHAEGVNDIPEGMPALSIVNIPAVTYAGKQSFTMESLSLLDPSSQALWTRSLIEQFAKKTDAAAAVAMKAAATTTAQLLSSATAAQVEAAINAAQVTILNASTSEADGIWVDAGTWLFLKNLRYTSGEPAFPVYGPANRNGVSNGGGVYTGQITIQGLPVYVANHFAGGTFVVGNSKGAYVYEGDLPTIEAYNTDTFSKTAVVAGRLGTYFRPEYFVKFQDGVQGATPSGSWN
jgi:hypothetical protein